MSLESRRPLLSLCIPTLDGGERYQRLLRSIGEHTTVDYEIVTVIGGGVRGYTEPQSEAMAAGRGEFLVAINDDVQLAPGWANPMLDAAQAGAWCVTPAEDQDGPVLLFAPHCMLWRAEIWHELGGLDLRFRHWCSDIDLARRLFEAGRPPVLVKLPQPVRHDVSATSSQHNLGPVCLEDLDRYRQKWGVDCNEDKHRLGAL